MAFQFEEQLALPVEVLNDRENEKAVTRRIKMHLVEAYGQIALIGDFSKKKAAALGLLADADRQIGEFLKEYFSGA